MRLSAQHWLHGLAAFTATLVTTALTIAGGRLDWKAFLTAAIPTAVTLGGHILEHPAAKTTIAQPQTGPPEIPSI